MTELPVFRLHLMSLEQLISLGNRMKSLGLLARQEMENPATNVPIKQLTSLLESTTFVVEEILEEFNTRGV